MQLQPMQIWFFCSTPVIQCKAYETGLDYMSCILKYFWKFDWEVSFGQENWQIMCICYF